jgi:hypothetical protein
MVNVTRILPISRFTVDQLVKTGIADNMIIPPNKLKAHHVKVKDNSPFAVRMQLNIQCE